MSGMMSSTVLDLPVSITRLIGTNYAPSEEEVCQIKEWVKKLNARLANGELDPGAAEISSHLNAMLSLARRLPPEIVAMIFAFCCPPDKPSESPVHALLRLGQICRAWRDVLCSTPHLWSSLVIHFPITAVYRAELVEKVLSTIHTWLERSKPFPMSIVFIDLGRFPPNRIAPIVDTLLIHSHRWKHISFYISSECFPLLFNFTDSTLSSLESLEIHDNLEHVPGQHSPALRLRSAPRLKSLSFTTQRFTNDHITFCWKQLTELSLLYEPNHYRMPHHDGFLKVLKQCSNIKICSLGIGMPLGDDAIEPSKTITLHHLHTFRIRRLWQESITGGFLDALILPQLKILEIDSTAEFIWTAMSWHGGQFAPLLSRSGCQLETLSVTNVHFSEYELLDCLLHTPSLKHLAYVPCPRWDSVFEIVHALTINAGSTPTPRKINASFKNLESLRLGSGLGASSAFGIFARMVASRWSPFSRESGVSRLSRIALSYIVIPWGIPPSEIDIENFRKQLWDCAGDDSHFSATVEVEQPYKPIYLQVPGHDVDFRTRFW
ncbi:hypothetical protein BJ138DRAFT_1109899 [Hygrophoropsis aurantiaca]|uniref:Uncharacterized protein n=1 Tax=Hygrophoropsis aurantiaca TaxID=72124 RepID=A0ACB8APG1_9AGAM|nr:hypothetical protein BJ138DRAFT_1109899 [Hygrophoropsis aurantiaca]